MKYNTKGVSIMEITDIRLKKVTKEGKMKAIVSITLDNGWKETNK